VPGLALSKGSVMVQFPSAEMLAPLKATVDAVLVSWAEPVHVVVGAGVEASVRPAGTENLKLD
jgi:hypothetical protein